MRVCHISVSSAIHTNEILDIAFAATAIKTQDVHGSSFRYAKVMTLPFFGSGMVEIPPDGYKRMKNSRKMQMVFFVHEGKVTVDIEDVQFGMTKGGVSSFSILPLVLFASLVLHSAKEQRAEMCSSPQQCICKSLTHRLVFEVTPGNTCLCSNTRTDVKIESCPPGFLCHRQSETWGTATVCDPWYWGTLEDRRSTGCGLLLQTDCVTFVDSRDACGCLCYHLDRFSSPAHFFASLFNEIKRIAKLIVVCLNRKQLRHYE
jgi:hypothetical protein